MSDNALSHTTGSLSQDALQILHAIGRIAESEGMNSYLVGGAVRDTLLQRPVHDLDICIEGNALELTDKIEAELNAVISMKSQFLTARIELAGMTIDIATCRKESYAEPASLPIVQPSSVERDLARRDFTINAMAIDISPTNWGELIDPFHGNEDLENRTVRTLHEDSFADDPTRIFRALRYSKRLDFAISPSTIVDIGRYANYINKLSSDRIIAELGKMYTEPRFTHIFTSASQLGIMSIIHPGFQWSDSHVSAIQKALDQGLSPEDAFIATTGYLLSEEDQIAALAERITNSSRSRDLLIDTVAIRSLENQLTQPDLKPSLIHAYLGKYAPPAIEATRALTDNVPFAEILSRELTEFRLVQTSLTAKDLLAMDVPQGPAIGAILETLRTTVLDYPETTREAEVTVVRKWLRENSGQG